MAISGEEARKRIKDGVIESPIGDKLYPACAKMREESRGQEKIKYSIELGTEKGQLEEGMPVQPGMSINAVIHKSKFSNGKLRERIAEDGRTLTGEEEERD